MRTESARMSSAAETRFRIQSQPPTARAVRVVALESVTAQDVAALVADLDAVDLVVMVTPAGGEAHAASIIGEACSRARVMTMSVVVRGTTASEDALSTTLAQVRPWSLMVVVLGDEDYLDDIIRSFR
jgi:hypothetical protein